MKLAMVAKGTRISRTPRSENKKLYVANSVIQISFIILYNNKNNNNKNNNKTKPRSKRTL